MVSPSPLMGGGAPSLTLVPLWTSPLAPPPSLRIAVGGGASQVLGVALHLLYQATHEGRARLLGGCPPLSFGLRGPPPLTPLLLHAVRWERTLLRECPFFGALVCPPPFLCLHAMRWGRTLSSPLPVASWPSSCRSALLQGGGLRLRPPAAPLSLPPWSPPPLPPLLPLPSHPLVSRICWARYGVAGVWPLYGPPPGEKLIIRATMALACSYGVPLPPNGGRCALSDPGPSMDLPSCPSPFASYRGGGGGFSGLGRCSTSPVSGHA